MSGEDNFIARWSRRKSEAAQGKPVDAEPEAPDRVARAAPPPAAEAPQDAHKQPEPPFDPAALPSIETIVADSDISAFLKKGVPDELTNAALRRAWSADPEIRDFIGLVESQWDFTDPTAMPGFGPLRATDDLHKLVAQAVGNLPEAPQPPAGQDRDGGPAAAAANAGGPPEPTAQEPTDQEPAQKPADDGEIVAMPAASQHAEPVEEGGTLPSRKGHGRALPR